MVYKWRDFRTNHKSWPHRSFRLRHGHRANNTSLDYRGFNKKRPHWMSVLFWTLDKTQSCFEYFKNSRNPHQGHVAQYHQQKARCHLEFEIRALRPPTVESPAQKSWSLSCNPLWFWVLTIIKIELNLVKLEWKMLCSWKFTGGVPSV